MGQRYYVHNGVVEVADDVDVSWAAPDGEFAEATLHFSDGSTSDRLVPAFARKDVMFVRYVHPESEKGCVFPFDIAWTKLPVKRFRRLEDDALVEIVSVIRYLGEIVKVAGNDTLFSYIHTRFSDGSEDRSRYPQSDVESALLSVYLEVVEPKSAYHRYPETLANFCDSSQYIGADLQEGDKT